MKSGNGADDKYGANGTLMQMPQMKVGGNDVMIYFPCIDCSVEEDRIEKARGKVIVPKFVIAKYGFCLWCEDTKDNIRLLICQKTVSGSYD